MMVHVPLMFLWESHEFPLVPCLAGKKHDDSSRRLTSFLSASITRKDFQFGTWTDPSFQRHFWFRPMNGERGRAKDLPAPPTLICTKLFLSVLCGHEVWALSIREKANYRCLNNKVFWEICGPKTDDSNLGCCVMRNLGSLCWLYDIKLMNCRRLQWAGLGWVWWRQRVVSRLWYSGMWLELVPTIWRNLLSPSSGSSTLKMGWSSEMVW